jgi:hypothetical protein
MSLVASDKMPFVFTESRYSIFNWKKKQEFCFYFQGRLYYTEIFFLTLILTAS